MSEADVEIIRRLYEGFAHGDFGATPEVWHPEIRSGRVMGGSGLEGAGLSGEWEGLEGLATNAWLWLEAWADLQVEACEFIDTGEKIVVLTHQRGVGRSSGAPLDREMADVYEVRDGKITAAHFYWNRADALAAAGIERP
jgi:ketosteroid isomerase-like protein